MTTATVDTPNTEKSSRQWLLAVFAGITAIVALNIFIEWRMDVFGVLRDPRGRQLITSRRERQAKYLLNGAYVPENFNALVVGPSASMNWPMSGLTGYRFYNESLEGGNATEERKIVEHALARGSFRVALVGLAPRVTQWHTQEDGLDGARWQEALGSLNAFDLQIETARTRLLHRESIYHPDGSHETNFRFPGPIGAGAPKIPVDQDPKAVADYRALMEELKAHGVRILYVVYPLYGPSLAYNRDNYAEYMDTIHRNLPPGPILDFNRPEYASFRDDPDNFMDEIHLTRIGADRLTAMVNKEMHRVLGDDS